PVYWGNRNWHPMLEDTVRRMRDDGVKRAVALATSAFGSYSGCRQYREDVERVRAAVPDAPEIGKLPPFCLHAGFLDAVESCVREAMAKLPDARIVYTAHSIPVSMAQSAPYEYQLRTVARTVNQRLGLGEPEMLYQSRSGPPAQPWLEPDVTAFIRQTDAKKLIVVPVGFLSDHMEVLFDLDTEAKAAAEERGIEFVRAATVGTHPRFVDAIEDLVRTAMANGVTACAPDCCRPAARPQRPATTEARA
ncbi:MAG: ferrochelatase, partial [Acidobacteriota bacterium]|nr:ferrochelatase [Acidobacteriota bacterium]